ncbi:MAG TPA: carboxypeptidase regulatory-like domain-containing protein, partial [Terriglobia bacterium]|nr:carboxypeptidase regulatory-like domain-containing protein [Terriglobia bacterium]
GFAQANNGTVGGVVQDSTSALIPGVTVTLTNTETGVVDTRLTNESGAYNFPSVPPGTYKISGDLTGFTSDIKTNIAVGTGNQIRIDLVLKVGGAPATSVTVNSASDNNQIRETSSSIGEVLSGDKVHDLPVVGGNVLDLLNVLPGFRSSAGGPQFDTVGGLGLNSVNATINGLSTNSSKQSSEFVGYQIYTPTVINPDLVGEIKLILAPVDAELGRGNSQLQIQTRSGTNKYTGSAVWNVQNSAMDANTWLNNHTPTTQNGVQLSNSTKPDWLNRNQFTISGGGPILKNKTFFFALYDQQIVRARALQTNVVYTDTAKQGIWRYYPGWNPGNAALLNPNGCSTSSTGLTGTYYSVDALGNPLPSVPNPVCASGQAAGSTSTLAPVTLQCYSVFGNQKFDWRNNTMV